MKAWSWLLKKIDQISLLLGVCATLLFVPPWFILILFFDICIYLIPVITVLGIILGIIAIRFNKKYPEKYISFHRALIGLLLNIIMFIIGGVVTAAITNEFCIQNLRRLNETVIFYAESQVEGDGYLPASFDVLHLPPSDLRCRRYYFYGLYSERPYLLNAHLAGKQLDNFAKPERTIIIAIGNKENDTTFFSTPEEIDHPNHRLVSFLNGISTDYKGDIKRHLYSKNNRDIWYVYPKLK